MKIGEIVKQYREKHGLSMRQFAKLTGLSHAYIPLIERGTNHNGEPLIPSITAYKQIADAMGITLHELVKMVDEDERVDISAAGNNQVIPELFQITPHEKAVIEAYRNHPALCSAVDRLLEVAPLSPEDEANARTVSAVVEAVLDIKKEGVPTK